MKRLLPAFCIVLVATTAFAFDSSKHVQRIGVLRGSFDGESRMTRALIDELRGRGFDAFDAGRTYDELLDEEAVPIADYIVEIRGGEPRTTDNGGIGIATRHAEVEVGIVTSRMNAELRVYDGSTMELVATSDLKKRSTALMPTGVGIGGGAIYAYLALPLIERAQHRSVAKKVAREAASFVTATVRGE
jgi:hypothetical protein